MVEPFEPSTPPSGQSSLSRRSFLKGAGGVAAGAASLSATESEAGTATLEAARTPERISGARQIELSINGSASSVTVEPRTTLLGALRVHCDPPLTGAKEVCDRGSCGACTVLVDGKPNYACMLLALDCRGKEITTVEGLGQPGSLSPVQQAFWQEDALMCGFCTPGFVVSVTACLAENPAVSEADVRSACAGNVCRCGTYPHVFRAALAAAGKSPHGIEPQKKEGRR